MFVGDPHRPEIIVPADIDDQVKHGRVKMHVFMGVDMVQPQTGLAESLELRADFRLQLAPGPGKKKHPDSAADLV